MLNTPPGIFTRRRGLIVPGAPRFRRPVLPRYMPRWRRGLAALNMAVGDHVLGTGGAKAVRAGTGEKILSDGTDGCGPSVYRQWRYCDQGVGYALADRWSLDTGTYPQFLKETSSGTCFFRNDDDPTSETPGTLMGAGTTQTGCGTCDCATETCNAYAAVFPGRCVPNELTVTLSEMTASLWVCPAGAQTGNTTSSGTAIGTYTCQQNGILLTYAEIRVGGCSWVSTTASSEHLLQYNLDCSDSDSDEIVYNYDPNVLWVEVDIDPDTGLIEIGAAAVKYNAFGAEFGYRSFAYIGSPAGAAGFTGTYANQVTDRDVPGNPYGQSLSYGGTCTITEG